MAWTTQQYTDLQNAIATGATKVRYSDKEVTYRSLEEMRSLLAEMAAELGIVTTSGAGRRVANFTSSLYPQTNNEPGGGCC